VADIPDVLDLLYRAVRMTKQMLITAGTCMDEMEGRCQARNFLHAELRCPLETKYEGVVRFTVLRVEMPIMYWARRQDIKIARMYQKQVLGMASWRGEVWTSVQTKLVKRSA